MAQAMAAVGEEQRIRETAYHLWEKAGRPAGEAEQHWELAKQLLSAPANDAVQPSTKRRAPAKARRARA